jgi:hypothetical protein
MLLVYADLFDWPDEVEIRAIADSMFYYDDDETS